MGCDVPNVLSCQVAYFGLYEYLKCELSVAFHAATASSETDFTPAIKWGSMLLAGGFAGVFSVRMRRSAALLCAGC